MRSAPGGKGWRGTIGPRSATRAGVGARDLRHQHGVGAIRAAPGPSPAGSGLGRPSAPRRAPSSAISPNTSTSISAALGCARPGWSAAAPARARPPARSCSSACGEQPGLARAAAPAGPARTTVSQRSSRHCAANAAGIERRDAATAFRRPAARAAASSARPANELTAQQPRMAASCCDAGLRAATASPPAISSAWLRATGTRPSGVTSQVTTATWAAGLPSRSIGGGGIDRCRAVSRSSNGITPSGRLGAEAADVADREELGRDLHGELAVIDVADARRR